MAVCKPDKKFSSNPAQQLHGPGFPSNIHMRMGRFCVYGPGSDEKIAYDARIEKLNYHKLSLLGERPVNFSLF